MNIIRDNGSVIEHAEKKLLVFHCMDTEQKYHPNPGNKLTQADFDLANKLGARIGPDSYAPLLNKDISAIPEADLIDMTDTDWQSAQQDIEKYLNLLLNNPGIACAVLTKVLHTKRPKLIPVCDSIIIKYILPDQNSDNKSAATIIGIMNEFRKDGKKNLETLSKIRLFLEQQGWKPALSNIRMLEKLYWMENVNQPYQELWHLMRMQEWWR